MTTTPHATALDTLQQQQPQDGSLLSAAFGTPGDPQRQRQPEQVVERFRGHGAPIVEPRRQRLERERREAEHRPGVFEMIGLGADSDWVLPHAGRWFRRRGFKFDPDFNAFANDETFQQLTEGIPREQWSAFDDALSMPHAQKIREQQLELADTRDRLAAAGWGGVAARMGAMILDPAAIALSIGTAGLGGGAVYGAQLTRMQRLVRGGMVAGGHSAAIEGYLLTEDPERSVADVTWAGAGGFVLGGGVNVLVGERLARAARKAQKGIEFAELREAAIRQNLVQVERADQVNDAVRANVLTRNGRAYFREQLDPAEQRRFLDNLIETSGLDPVEDADMIARLRELDPAEAATFFGDPARPSVRMPGVDGETGIDSGLLWGQKQTGDFDPSRASAAKATMTRWRRSFSSLLGSSDVESVRRVGSMYADDPLLRADGTGGGHAASLWAQRQTNTRMARYYREALPELRAWQAERGIGSAMSDKARIEFFEEVGRAIRHPRGQYTDNPHVNRVADLQRQLQRDLLGLARRHRVKGFENVEPSDTYIMRVWNQGRLNELTARHGEDVVNRMFARALMAGSEDLAQEQADAIARGFVRTVRRLDEYSELQKARMFDEDQADLLAQVLRENVPDITDAQVEDILYTTTRRDPQTGVPARARRRLRIDENYEATMPDGTRVAVADLLENNAETILNVYTRQMVGSSAASEIYRAMRRTPDDVIETFDQLASRLETDMRQAGVSVDRINRDIDMLRTLDKHVRGMPVTKNTSTARTLRRLRAMTHIGLSGQFGVAQIGELGNILAETGVRAMMRQTPAMARVIRRARNGDLPDDLMRELENWVGIGTERMTGQVYNRFDQTAQALEFGGGALDRTLQRGVRLSNDLSFMAPINSGLQRLAAASAAQRITDQAYARATMSARRMADLGLTSDDVQRLHTQLRRHSTVEDGLLGRRLRRMNIDAWDDQEVASRFIAGLDRWSRRMIQTSDIGSLHPYMATDLGRVIFQFRNFVIQAWEKQFLHRVQMRDWQAFASTAYVSMVAGLAYTAQQYALSIGRPDADEYRRERLSTEAVARAAVQRGAWSSIMPGVVDTGGWLAGADPIFTYRHSGLDTDFIFGNPLTDTVEHGARAVRRTAQAAREQRFTEREADAWRRLVPFQRVFGIANVLESMPQTLPED